MSVRVLYAAPFGCNRTVSSGTNYAIGECLTKHFTNVDVLCPLSTNMSFVSRVVGVLNRKGVWPSRHLPYHTWRNASAMAQDIDERLVQRPADVIVLPTTIPAASLASRLPVIVYADATVARMVGYYDNFCNVSRSAEAEALAVEQAAFERSCAICVTSDWAKDSVIEDYGIDAAKVHVLPRGANFDPELRPMDVATLRARAVESPVRLLFVGRYWERKGGPLVLKTLSLLREAGHNVTLTVVGCRPSIPPELRSFVSVAGPLSSDDVRDRAELDRAFRESTLLFVPSAAEAMGIMYCDACAYGLPIVARDTGGVSSVVRDGENGRLLAPQATAKGYADAIAGIVSDNEAYLRFSVSAFEFYQTTGNWRTVGDFLGAQVNEAMKLSSG